MRILWRVIFLLLPIFSYGQESLERMNAIMGEEVLFSGPNCHNTALRVLGLNQGRRYVSEQEVLQVLENECIALEEPIEGALGI